MNQERKQIADIDICAWGWARDSWKLWGNDAKLGKSLLCAVLGVVQAQGSGQHRVRSGPGFGVVGR